MINQNVVLKRCFMCKCIKHRKEIPFLYLFLLLSFYAEASESISSLNSSRMVPDVNIINDQTTKIVRGKILDIQGQPMPGVNISIKGKTVGAISDIDGFYSIQATPGDILVFTFVGCEKQELPLPKKGELNVVMKEQMNELDEAVVVGMGTQRKASVIGAVSPVQISEIKAPTRSLTAAMSGKIAGAVVVQRSGEPGQDSPNFWIRGISTFGANQSPLVLVDGVERDMQDISVDEVESLSILKDASATAVYGVRAANGVVLVTTRKGIAQKPSVELKLESGISDLTKMPKFLSGPDYAMLYNEAQGFETFSPEYIQKMRDGVDPYLYPNVDWFDETFKKWASNTNATLNIRGGGEVARYFVSASFFNEDGNMRNNPENDYNSNINLKRYNFRSNVDFTLTKSTVLNLEIGANLVDVHSPGIGGTLYGQYYTPAQHLFYYSYLATPISNPVRVPIGVDKYGNDIMGWGAPTQVGERNPAERLMGSGYNTEYRTQIMSQVVLNQDLSMLLKGLDFKAFFSFDANNGTTINRRKESSIYGVQGRDPNTNELIVKEVEKGQDFLSYSKWLYSNRAKELKFQLNYNELFNRKHRVGAMFMYYQRDYINGSAESSILALSYKKQGLAARTTYSFDDRYFAEFNLGYNGSENFPKHNRYGFFPAGAVGWMISNEPFWSSMSQAMSVFKIKGSIGLVGAEALAGGRRFGYLSTFGGGLGGYNFGLSGGYIGGVGEDQIGVQNLTWEKGLKKNIGAEMKFINSTLSLDVDFFHERRSDILIQRQSIPEISGTNTQPFANMGIMVNKGFDATLNYNNDIGDLTYSLYGNFTFTRNKIIEQDEAKRKYEYQMRTGHRYGQNFGLIALGLFKDQDEIDESPIQKFGVVRPGDVKYKDVNEDGEITIEDEMPIGYSSIPEIIYGFGLQLSYKGFDLGVFFRGQAHVTYGLGGSTFIPFAEGVGKGNLFEKALDRWTPENPNPNAFYPRLSNGKSTNNWQASTRNIYDGSFLRLADAEFGYNFPKKMIKRIGMTSLRVYVLGSNLALLSKWDLWDPETGVHNGGNYPLSRKINIGIRTSF